jgi:hypothetical protein
MKRKLSFVGALLFTCVCIYSQQPVLGDKIEKEFEVTAIPDKWKNESAIIIGQKTEYLFSRLASGKNLHP